ncbi:hypothetical protein GCM10018793_37750 [Streptomyces sulfonofaciens]|uniref:Uncharacterized protein n=1 Tax=Streptomyces sulfonofaciens TaxID=68272 RepID=A0A919GAG4_9ACTN|nr:hypothetical protein GCM10018793_37750 [Streptomyces sulfonofaciens]
MAPEVAGPLPGPPPQGHPDAPGGRRERPSGPPVRLRQEPSTRWYHVSPTTMSEIPRDSQ